MNGNGQSVNDLWAQVLANSPQSLKAPVVLPGTIGPPNTPPPPPAFIGPPNDPPLPPAVVAPPPRPPVGAQVSDTGQVHRPAFSGTGPMQTPGGGPPPIPENRDGGLDAADLVAGDREHRGMSEQQVRRGLTPEKAAAENAAATQALGNKYATAGAPGERDAAPPTITWGGGGGGTQTIAAHEQALVAAPRQAAMLGAVDAEGKAIKGEQSAAVASGDAAADVETAKAQGLRDQADVTKEAAAAAKARTAQAKADAAAFRAHIDHFSAQIANDKIDPNGMWNNSSTGQKVAWTLAKAFGAVGQAFLHTPTNQVADHIDQMAAQDVAAQRQNHETGRERVQDMNSMYAQALRATGDAEEAERVAQGYALTAAKQQAEALATDATSKQQKARGAELSAALDERIALLEQKRVKIGIDMNPLVQARTVSTGPDMKEVYKTARQFSEEQAKLGTVVAPDDAIRWAYKMHTGTDPFRNGGVFAQGAKAEPGGKTEKLDEARTEVQGGIGTIQRAIDSGAAYKQGPIGALWAHVPGATDSKMDALERDKYNAQVKGLVGAGWKLTTNGMEPKNPGIIEELSDHYQIKANDTPELARKRMTDLQDMLRDAGTSKGVLLEETKRDYAGVPNAYKPGGTKAPAPPSSLTPVNKK